MSPVPPTRFWIPVSGQTVPGLVTVALPPPIVCVPAPPSTPITAIDFVDAVDSGRIPLFFSSTVPSSAPCDATWACAGVVTVALGEPIGAWSKSPNANICVSTLVTIVLICAVVTVPAATAWDRKSA